MKSIFYIYSQIKTWPFSHPHVQ